MKGEKPRSRLILPEISTKAKVLNSFISPDLASSFGPMRYEARSLSLSLPIYSNLPDNVRELHQRAVHNYSDTTSVGSIPTQKQVEATDLSTKRIQK
mmetsp:Transcript_12705/g.25414  ORF Transcript_12705/g.25414 Transcript_12705/m.25414 type:complete len:97 (+) Transcript_12705:1004-1294(+)